MILVAAHLATDASRRNAQGRDADRERLQDPDVPTDRGNATAIRSIWRRA